MLYVREKDRLSSAVERIDGSCGTIVQLIIAVLTEEGFSQAYVHNGRLQVSTVHKRVKGKVPEKEPPRTTTTCLFAGASGDVDGL